MVSISWATSGKMNHVLAVGSSVSEDGGGERVVLRAVLLVELFLEAARHLAVGPLLALLLAQPAAFQPRQFLRQTLVVAAAVTVVVVVVFFFAVFVFVVDDDSSSVHYNRR